MKTHDALHRKPEIMKGGRVIESCRAAPLQALKTRLEFARPGKTETHITADIQDACTREEQASGCWIHRLAKWAVDPDGGACSVGALEEVRFEIDDWFHRQHPNHFPLRGPNPMPDWSAEGREGEQDI